MAYAIVTGASAGIGRELAKLFARDRIPLGLVARRAAELESLARDLSGAGSLDVRVVAADLSTREGRAQLFEATKDLEVDILVNNAGFGSNGRFWENDASRELQMVDLNVGAIVELTRHYLPAMVARGRGRVLNVGSTAGFQPGPLMATYYATKAFVNSFTEALANELAGTGVTATVSCPGPVATEFGAIAGNDKSALFKKAGGVASADWVAARAYEAMTRGEVVAVHGARLKVAMAMGKLVPRGVLTSMAGALNKRVDGA
jgi:short-subunit dehydrogenase